MHEVTTTCKIKGHQDRAIPGCPVMMAAGPGDSLVEALGNKSRELRHVSVHVSPGRGRT